MKKTTVSTEENNIRMVHENCAEENRKLFQENNPDLSLSGVLYAKIKFQHPKGPEAEWMWVQILNFNDKLRKFDGILSNTPVLLTYLPEGIIVKNVPYWEITDIQPGDQEHAEA